LQDDKTVQEIDIATMKSKRQQVLAVLKAAVVTSGEIALEFYLKFPRPSLFQYITPSSTAIAPILLSGSLTSGCVS
jgi:lipid A disaccharide synthetase